MSLPRFGEPSWSDGDYYHSSPHSVHPYPATATNLGGILSTHRLSSRSQILPDTYSQRHTDPPASYVHEYEIEIARWQTRRRAKQGRSECLLGCSVCLEAMAPSVWVRPTAGCGHEPRICEPCLGQYVMHGIQEGLTEVVCPDVECRHEMNRRDVMGYVREDPVCLNRYNTLVAQRELERQPNFVWCQNPRCGQGQIHSEGDASPLVICHYCHSSSCFTHRIPWHTGRTCEDYDLVILHEREIQANEDYIESHTKQCPHCSRPIEKITGCDHMTCLRPWGCGHEFCWTCLADYRTIFREGNHRHNPDCMYHTGNRSSSSIQTGCFLEPPIIICGYYSEVESESTVGSSESSSHAPFEPPPVPMSLRLRDSWEDLTALELAGPSHSDSWRGSTSSTSDETNSWETQSSEVLSRRTSGAQTTYAQTRQPSDTETWWPPTPLLPRAAEDWDRNRRYGRVW
ncbi:hypothetical protein ACGC1H_002334 [Rhizoctonia solani]